jgi:Flp pilus assembly protein CpaB
MRRSRIFILLAIILLLGAAAAYLFLRSGSGASTDGEATPVPVDVVFVAIAAQDISRGARIPADGVIMSRMNANLVVETMISGSDEEAIRSRVVDHIARQDIARGVPITEAMLTDTSGDLLLQFLWIDCQESPTPCRMGMLSMYSFLYCSWILIKISRRYCLTRLYRYMVLAERQNFRRAI